MGLPTIESTGTLAGILALVVLELIKQRKQSSKDVREMNGGNPVVLAVKDLQEANRIGQAETREKIAECFCAMDKRMAEHESREERKWESVDDQLRRWAR